jgi:CheY-like chemotaxis protein
MSRVLVVEDSADDLLLLRRAFAKLNLEQLIEVATDGEAAISYLKDPNKPHPELVLLDLNLPKRSGFEVLGWIRQHAHVKHLPVVILSSSSEPNDLKRAYALGANGYLEKTSIPEQLQAIVQASSDFWLRWNQTPHTTV